MKINPHSHSIDGSAAPSAETLKDLGFSDLNAALANTVVALENAPAAAPRRNGVSKEELTSLVKEAIVEGNHNLKREFKANMKTLKEDILYYKKTGVNVTAIYDCRSGMTPA